MKPTLVFDCEIYRNYFLVQFRNVETGNVRAFEIFDGQALDIATLRKVLSSYRLVSFNGNGFDLPLLSMALKGKNCAVIKRACDSIIKNNLRYWQLERKYNFKTIEPDHIDLIEVAPGFASLKLYGGRMGCRKLQDLPIDPDAEIKPEQRAEMREYCANDLELTQALFEKLGAQIALREEMGELYGMDLRSKSDAQIAEVVIGSEVGKIRGAPVRRPEVQAGMMFHYTPPNFIQFTSNVLQQVLDDVKAATFTVPATGSVLMPKSLKGRQVSIGDSVYRMGIGGLHSSEKCAAHVADASTLLMDRDVASYYPSIVLRCGLRPAHMGDAFTTVYRALVDRRLKAKKAGDKVVADSLKITINGTFGKTGSRYSILYSPDLLIQITLTGQLALLMLIEAMESDGIPVVSANTDGVILACPRDREAMMEMIMLEWEYNTGFKTEATLYKAVYARDVNNYMAVKPDGTVKCKGVFAEDGLQKNPTALVSVEAAKAHLTAGTPIKDFVHNYKDISGFVCVRTVKGGALYNGQLIGKVIRWYYAKGIESVITYKVNGYKVPSSDGAIPMMELPDVFPPDMDYNRYITMAHTLLHNVGVHDTEDLPLLCA